jgi:hypothetical protein
MTARLLHEEARLRALFGRLVAMSLTAAPLGCSSGDDSAAGKDASSQADSTIGNASPDGGESDALPLDGGSVGDASAPHDSACDPVYLDDASDGACDYYERLACNLPPGTATEGCAVFLVTCAQICGQTAAYPCDVAECLESGTIPASGPITVECTTGRAGCADGGRRPAGLVEEAAARSQSALGAWLARLAWMEAASMHAFRTLRAELASLGAPRTLLCAAERAERDEARHARVASRLARRRGVTPVRARVAPRRVRSLETIARENAVEGCVRETFSALVAGWQAQHATDPELAAAMKAIAEDETRHAALAWAVARWLEPQLDRGARRILRASVRGALRALRCEVSTLPPSLAHAAGLPSRAEGAALVDLFAAALFV